jgi:uncharacterized protein YegL
MLKTQLTTVQSNILSHHFIPENVRQLVARRTEKGKTFGKLDIIASPPALIAKSDKYPPLNIVTGFTLDTSGSMEGDKIKQAVNTIKQLTQIILEERNGKTLEHQPIHAWIYVISFNSVAELVIPFQEITEETVPGILSQLDCIRVSGSTNYEQAFKKQREVIGNIIQTLTANPDPSKRQFHFIRFFESDGEITQGTNEIDWLYRAMRNTTASASASSAAATASAAAASASTHFTFEDYVIGYGTGVDIECLKQLASPIPPPQPPKRESSGGMFAEGGEHNPSSSSNSSDAEYNCSTLITVVRPEDIGWQVGEILYKQIMRVGIKLKVSVESKDPSAGVAELFEYQTNQWGTSTTFHSITHNEKKVMYIQYTPTAAAPADAPTDATPEVIVRVQCENQYTGAKYTYAFSHKSEPSCTLTPLLQRQANSMTPAEIGLAISETDRAKILVIPIIQGMIHIEVFKQFRELEGTSYNKTVIVREAYNTMLMLKAIDARTKDHFIHTIAPKTANLITDVKLIIGLTAINDPTEQRCIIHGRRTASADEDFFNSGTTASRKYVEGEENYKEVAEEIIKKRDAQQQQQQQQVAAAAAPTDDEYDQELVSDAVSDYIPSRIATCMTPQSSSSHHRHPYHRNAKRNPPSLLRILCARIALSKLKNEDKTPETIYDEMVRESIHYDGEYNEDPSYFHTRDTPYDDVFSTPSQDDEYSQRRMGMMRQMSSPSS